MSAKRLATDGNDGNYGSDDEGDSNERNVLDMAFSAALAANSVCRDAQAKDSAYTVGP